MIPTDCLNQSTINNIGSLKSKGFTITLLDCSKLPHRSKLYVRNRRNFLIKILLNAAKRTSNQFFLKRKLKQYKYAIKYAKLKISL